MGDSADECTGFGNQLRARAGVTDLKLGYGLELYRGADLSSLDLLTTPKT